jgi:hypothetical protein
MPNAPVFLTTRYKYIIKIDENFKNISLYNSKKISNILPGINFMGHAPCIFEPFSEFITLVSVEGRFTPRIGFSNMLFRACVIDLKKADILFS